MTLQELELLIQGGEGYNVEYKQSFPSKLSELATELCAFANANGGVILVGIDDKQQITGITLDNVQRSRIQSVINLIDPSLPILVSEYKVNGKIILCFECPVGEQKPYAVSGNIYVRNGPNSEKIISIEQMRKFFQHSDSIFFDTAPCPSFKYPGDFDSACFREFIRKAGITANISEISLLENLRLTGTNKQIINAGVLLFAKNVQKHIDHATIRCVLFKGIDKRYILDDKEMTGNLVEQIDFVEKVGSGIRRMRDAMKEANLIEPKFEIGGFFTVIFYRPVAFEKWLEGWGLHLTTPQTKILLAIHDEERITKIQLTNVIGQGKSSVDRNINKLRNLGLLTREGSDKSGRWLVNQLPPPIE